MIYNRSKEYNIEFETYIYRGEIEIPLNIEGEYYSGSHPDDDPAEFIINSATVAEDTQHEEGEKPDYVKGQKLKLTEEEEHDIENKYLKLHE